MVPRAQDWALSLVPVLPGPRGVWGGDGSEWSPGCEEQNHSQRLKTLKFHGWVIRPTPVMSSHCVTLSAVSLHPSPWGTFQMVGGGGVLLSSSEAAGGLVGCGGWELGQVGERGPGLSLVIFR